LKHLCWLQHHKQIVRLIQNCANTSYNHTYFIFITGMQFVQTIDFKWCAFRTCGSLFPIIETNNIGRCEIEKRSALWTYN
jgi:hypothetical protein